ncbi:4-hydroxy-tetrahydrodipicolinate reductase, partial [bacterium]|nr:4-hydroxy-tetrahydrodipicolinate reductase [bacterium]
HLVSQAANALPTNFDAIIHETHHTAKKDRPSGTALSFEKKLKNNGPRRRIEIAGFRGGSIFGEHTIRLVSDLEDITFTHRALNRDVFASGALKAGTWLIKQSPGLYAFNDMLELN